MGLFSWSGNYVHVSLCYSAWEDKRCQCANIIWRCPQCQYEKTGTVGGIYWHMDTCNLICTKSQVFHSGHAHCQSQRTEARHRLTTLLHTSQPSLSLRKPMLTPYVHYIAQTSYCMAAHPHGKYWHCDITLCQYLLCGTQP